MKLTGAIIGLGKIGFGYDQDLPVSDYVLSHARALEQHSSVELIAGIDISQERIDLFRRSYQVPTYRSVKQFLEHARPNLVVIASPTKYLTQIADEILNAYSPSYILIEKPFSNDFELADNLNKRCENLGINLFVNYTRRASPAFIKVKSRILDGTFRGPFIGNAWYTNGILNNGSHMLNTLEYFFGDVLDIIDIKEIFRNENDPDIQFTLIFENCEIIIKPLPYRNFTTFQFQLFGANGVLALEPGFKGFTWTESDKDQVFSHLKMLSGTTHTIKSDMQFAQLHVTESIINNLGGTSQNICSGRDGVRTLEHISNIIKSI